MAKKQIIKALISSAIIWLCTISPVHADVTIADATSKVTNSTTPQPVTLSDDEISSFGCLVGGAGLVSAAYLAGPSEAIMLWGGGLLTPSGTGVLAVSILGGLGGAGCSLGATMAPALAWGKARLGW